MKRGVIVRAVLVIGLVMVVMAFLVSLAIVQYGQDHGAGPIVADAFAFPVSLVCGCTYGAALGRPMIQATRAR